MRSEDQHRIGNDFWDGADLVMEVVSEDDPDRDWITKRQEYSESGISEYWIIDPRTKTVTILKLDGKTYAVHGEFKPGTEASSVLIKGFTANVDEVFSAGQATK